MWYLALLKDKPLLLKHVMLLLQFEITATRWEQWCRKMTTLARAEDSSASKSKFAMPTIMIKLKAKQGVTTPNIVRTTLFSVYAHKRPICE